MSGYVGRERERKFLTCLNLGLKLCQAQGISKLTLNLLKCLTFDLFSPNNFSNNKKTLWNMEIFHLTLGVAVFWVLPSCDPSRRNDELGAEWLSWAVLSTWWRRIAGKGLEWWLESLTASIHDGPGKLGWRNWVSISLSEEKRE